MSISGAFAPFVVLAAILLVAVSLLLSLLRSPSDVMTSSASETLRRPTLRRVFADSVVVSFLSRADRSHCCWTFAQRLLRYVCLYLSSQMHGFGSSTCKFSLRTSMHFNAKIKKKKRKKNLENQTIGFQKKDAWHDVIIFFNRSKWFFFVWSSHQKCFLITQKRFCHVRDVLVSTKNIHITLRKEFLDLKICYFFHIRNVLDHIDHIRC